MDKPSRNTRMEPHIALFVKDNSLYGASFQGRDFEHELEVRLCNILLLMGSGLFPIYTTL